MQCNLQENFIYYGQKHNYLRKIEGIHYENISLFDGNRRQEDEFMSFGIVPGVVITNTIDTAEEKRFPCMVRNRLCLPEQGGVGVLPLPVVHQGRLPICTGVAAANARMILHYQQTGQIMQFSGLFIYKMNRLFDGLPNDMRGSTLEASMQTLEYKGVCSEYLYPSNARNCNKVFPRKSQRLLEQAKKYCIHAYRRCDSLEEILQTLAEGKPVAFSMVIYTDFFRTKDGVIPEKRTGIRIGGHSMVAVNYDLERRLLQVLQSWGKGAKGPTAQGYMYIPFCWFDYMDELTEHSVLIEAFALLE